MNSPDSSTPLIVGIGASAGGLEAFKTFFHSMSTDSGLAFVLVQHLDPVRDSMLVELLQRETGMPVAEAEDGARVEADHIFVIPPNASLTIKAGRLSVDKPAPPRAQRRPIDTFFTSLSNDQGENAVCIVLSGTGSDGTLGVRKIKEHGGYALAQAASGNDGAMQGMPQSAAATGLVDEVLEIDAMPAKLADYRKHLDAVAVHKDSEGTRQDAREHLDAVCKLLDERIGQDFSQYKDKTLTRRIQRRMQVLQVDSMPKYIERLKAEPSELERLFHEMLIGVTQFFRDPDAWEALRQDVIPRLFEHKGAADTVRVWVPGCATGEEVYTVAMLLREALARRDARPRIQIFGTDVDTRAVDVARAGRYKALPGVDPERLERWFVEDRDAYIPTKTLREMCVFSPHDLVKDPPFSKLDLVCCRNLLIYMKAALQDSLLRKFHYALRVDAWLFLGQAEGVSRNGKLFATTDKKHRIYQRRDAPTTTLHDFSLPGTAGPVGTPRPAAPAPDSSARANDDRIERNAHRAMQKYSPAYVVIDRHHDILRFSGGEAGRYLEPSAGAASLNLMSLARRALRPAVRSAVQKAFTSGRAVIQEKLTLRVDGEARAITLIAEPLESNDSLCVVAFQDTGPADAGKRDDRDTQPGVAELEQELHTTRMQLHSTINELEATNEEMKSANEEYQSVNEELQSSNEELETSKEEMQSINEELQTINAELTSKNNQLNRANSDLQNLLESTEIATIFLDNELHVKSFTPTMRDLFHLRDTDRGRPVTDIVTRLDYADLKRDVREVLRSLGSIEREVRVVQSDATYIMRIRPYRTVDNVIDGVVITFVDISGRKRHESERARLAAIVDSSQDAIIGHNLDGTITAWNHAAETIFGYTADQTIGEPIAMLLPRHAADEMPRLLNNMRRGTNPVPQNDVIRIGRGGREVEVSVTISPVINARGELIAASTIARDIAERKRDQAGRARLAAIVDSSDDAIVSMDIDGVIQTWNKGAEKLFGYSAEEAIGQPVAILTPADRQDEDGDIVRRVRRGEVTDGFETVRRRKDGDEVAISLTVSPIENVAGNIIGASKIARDVSERRAADAHREMLLQELSHRVKNSLASVQAIATQTLHTTSDLHTFNDVFQARLQALARTHDLLVRGDWHGTDLAELIDRSLEPYSNDDQSRWTTHGKDIDIDAKAALALGMTFHELATNAAKYGALSREEGSVEIKWQVQRKGMLHWTWVERGGPRVEKPAHSGFGSRLIKTGLEYELEADVNLEYQPSGLRCTIDVPLANLLPRKAGKG